jgi:hypothetical protein
MSLLRAITIIVLVGSVSGFAVACALATAADFTTAVVLLAAAICACGAAIEIGLRSDDGLGHP